MTRSVGALSFYKLALFQSHSVSHRSWNCSDSDRVNNDPVSQPYGQWIIKYLIKYINIYILSKKIEFHYPV